MVDIGRDVLAATDGSGVGESELTSVISHFVVWVITIDIHVQ